MTKSTRKRKIFVSTRGMKSLIKHSISFNKLLNYPRAGRALLLLTNLTELYF